MMDPATSKAETPGKNPTQQDQQIIRMATKSKLDANVEALSELREQSGRPGWVISQNALNE